MKWVNNNHYTLCPKCNYTVGHSSQKYSHLYDHAVSISNENSQWYNSHSSWIQLEVNTLNNGLIVPMLYSHYIAILYMYIY